MTLPLGGYVLDQHPEQDSFRRHARGGPCHLKGNKSVTVSNQGVEIALFCPLMIPCLHTVEVEQLSSG